ncbi:hypothetical protein TELCIR_11723 [Teladorsagia circumcincta]|uniref:Sulfatase N-terminal domain-containing protein n=1 Tax=Teladorsagia circumcincta TaxID=45464 RepID=A0A2G9UAN6_TELCI|nr:hypothetical protein TELCIR_11723 [Teladorsagia circumcincta]
MTGHEGILNGSAKEREGVPRILGPESGQITHAYHLSWVDTPSPKLQTVASVTDQWHRDLKRVVGGVDLFEELGGMLTSMDFAIGRVIDFLKASKKYDNTVIIFTSDNGGTTQFGASNRPLRGEKDTLWEGGTKTTTIVHAPKSIHINGIRPQDGDFKLILGNPDRRIQEDHGKARLYRITEDPGESNDLSKVHPGIVHR